MTKEELKESVDKNVDKIMQTAVWLAKTEKSSPESALIATLVSEIAALRTAIEIIIAPKEVA